MSELRAPYPSYKSSGIDWLSDIPAHWEERRGKTLYRKLQRTIADGAGTVTAFRDGQVTLRSNRRTQGFTEALQEVGYQGVKTGDLVIHAMDAFAGAVGVSESDGKCSPVYSVCEPLNAEEVDPRYTTLCLREIARNGYIQAQAKGIRERSTDFRFESFANNRFPLPPLDEQRAIADYLNRKDSQITRFIQSRRRMIALLEEKKQAIINQAVTRGLDPTVPMKDSGIEWLGEIPAHWEVGKLKQLAQVSPRITFEHEKDVDYRVPFLPMDSLGTDGKMDFAQKRHITEVASGFTRFEEGDFLLAKITPCFENGKAGIVRDLPGPVGFGSTEYHVIRPRSSSVLPEFIEHILRSGWFREIGEEHMTGSAGQKRVPTNFLKGFTLSIPPIEEQRAINERLEQLQQLTSLQSSKFEREIELVQEYRTRLISEVVTGKVRVL